MKRKLPAFIVASLVLISNISAQETFKTRASPLAQAQVKYKDGYMKIIYSQPVKRGREIFGKLVPYGQVWRAGANEATELTLTRDVMVNNQVLKAGTYSLFTIPNLNQWTIIINSDVGLWGAYNYTEKLDVMRFDVPVQQNPEIVEGFTILFEPKNEMANLLILWDAVKVEVPFKFLN